MSKSIFFRDDDADRDLPRLRRLLGLFEDHGLPLNCAVIPATLTDECASLLTGRGPWLDLHQHGWRHANHESSGRKCEFGPSRSFAQQFDDIARGKEQLDLVLGVRWSPVFTPPWNRCTTDTYRALASLEFRGISQDRLAPAAGMASIPVAVDLFNWKAGPALKALAPLQSEVSAALARPAPVGILLHHKVMDDDAFSRLAGLIRWLAGEPETTFHTFKDLLEASPWVN